MQREAAIRCGARHGNRPCRRRPTVAFIIGGGGNPPLLRCASDADELREALGRFLREGTWMEERIAPAVDPENV